MIDFFKLRIDAIPCGIAPHARDVLCCTHSTLLAVTLFFYENGMLARLANKAEKEVRDRQSSLGD